MSSEQPTLTVPDTLTREILSAEQATKTLHDKLQIQQLVRENLILSAALELGLDKQRLSELELAHVDGQLIFREVARPASPEKTDAGNV